MEGQKLALLMGTHERLGKDAYFSLSQFDRNLMRVIFSFAFPRKSLEHFEGIVETSFRKTDATENSSAFLVFDLVGNLIVSNGMRLQWFSPEGNLLKSLPIGEPLKFMPRGLALLNEKTLVISDLTNDRICFVSVEDGRILKTIGQRGAKEGQFRFPDGIAVDSEHEKIFVVDCWNNRVQVFKYNGDFMYSFGTLGSGKGELNFPSGVAINPENGDAVVVDTCNDRVTIFSNNGGWLRSFGRMGKENGEFDIPLGIAIDCNGNVVVSEHNNHRVQLFNRNGEFLKSFGWELNFPFGVAIDDTGRIAVVGSENSTVQIFS